MARELTIRESDFGGRYRNSVEPHNTVLNDHNPLVFLVHGYNVHGNKARESYRVYEKNLLFSNRIRAEYIWKFFWPGSYKNWVKSGAYYFRQVRKSNEFGKRFAEFISTTLINSNSAAPIIFVGHSLGCRVILELLYELKKKYSTKPQHLAKLKRIKIILMAAAVPISLVKKGRRFNDLIIDKLGSKHVLYSTNDSVLKIPFRIGEVLASDGIWPEAVGLKGNPENIWNSPRRNTYLKHGDYWENNDNAKYFLDRYNGAVERSLGKNQIVSEDIPGRSIKERDMRISG